MQGYLETLTSIQGYPETLTSVQGCPEALKSIQGYPETLSNEHPHVSPRQRERVLYWQPTGPSPLYHRDD